MFGPKTITALFTRDIYTLTVTKSGSGTVTYPPGPFYYGDTAQIAAVPEAGWLFNGWTGGATGMVNPLTVMLDGNKSIQANFIQEEFSVNFDVTGSGSISILPIKASYHYGDDVTITAVPAPGWKFDNWEGDQNGTTNPIQVEITGDLDLTAVFSTNQVFLPCLRK
jgi:uncharacterized repeat protein (TIGR02543 family)